MRNLQSWSFIALLSIKVVWNMLYSKKTFIGGRKTKIYVKTSSLQSFLGRQNVQWPPEVVETVPSK